MDGTKHLCTDTGNAARFVAQHGQKFRFCYAMNCWLHYTGKRWQPDATGRVMASAKQTALGVYLEAKSAGDEAERERLGKWANQSQRRERLAAMVELSKPELAILPDELDADIWALNCLNGTIDLRTGELRPHKPEDYQTKLCGAAYDPQAKAPTWDGFLSRIFQSKPALIPYAQKWAGYAATGSTREQAMLFAFGTGCNGKTVYFDAQSAALGDYAGKADPELLIAQDGSHPTNIADLQGRRMVVLSETNEGARFNESKLKDLVGETRLKARRMRTDFFEFRATHKIVMYSNHKPMVRGTDYGFWRRIRLVTFGERIEPYERDEDLPDKLRAELPGILRWIIEGAMLWQREGLGLPDEVAADTNDYRLDMDLLGRFLGECAIVDPALTAHASDLYAAYSTFSNESGERPVSQTRFGVALAERGFEGIRNPATRRKMWRGIGLNQEIPSYGS